MANFGSKHIFDTLTNILVNQIMILDAHFSFSSYLEPFYVVRNLNIGRESRIFRRILREAVDPENQYLL